MERRLRRWEECNALSFNSENVISRADKRFKAVRRKIAGSFIGTSLSKLFKKFIITKCFLEK